jgi:ferredoxin
MPWVDKDKCVGCGVCVEKCPVEAISMEDEKAVINMVTCIHCGTCHDVCPQEAVRHDGEKTPGDIKANVEKTRNFMEACAKYLGSIGEKSKCLERMIKHFKREKLVAEKTLEELDKLKNA